MTMSSNFPLRCSLERSDLYNAALGWIMLILNCRAVHKTPKYLVDAS